MKTVSKIAADYLRSGLEKHDAQAPTDALKLFSQAAELEPAWAEIRYRMALSHLALSDYLAAVAAAEAAVKADPRHASAAHVIGTTYCLLNRWEDALPWLRQAAQIQPDTPVFQRDLGVILLFFGEIDEARKALRRTLELDVLSNEVLFTLVRMTKMNDGSPEAEDLYQLVTNLEANVDRLPESERAQVLYSLAKVFEDRGNPNKAFDCLERANDLTRKRIAYDADENQWAFEGIAEAFDTPMIQRLSGLGIADNRPIFIVGMPRSGTTLVEQIISAHSQVYGGGEMPHMRTVAQGVRGAADEIFPHWAPLLDAKAIREIGKTYLALLPEGDADELRTTDKWLDNFKYLGLIHLCLPNAVIIHCHRDPGDCCFSAYSILFTQDQEFTYNQEELGRYWRDYDQLMAHWRSVLPPGKILDVPYEALVEDLEGWTRRLLDHCGLAWEEACLRYYESKRAVRSASVTQVRQPIYRDSMGRWKPFAHRLGPLFEAMGRETPSSE
ncbi:MAG: sulfotransferase [Caulobacteraceae bacterium]|nr:sulfotransferase [Caulobacteraceae bacterium]